MKRYLLIIVSLIAVGVICACSKTNTFIHCHDWVGEYSFHEEPVPTSTGINKIMQWELSVEKQNDTCFGVLEITGLTTYIKLLTTLSGDSSRVDVVYHQYLEGSEDYQPGDVLFSLSRDTNQIITHWNRLQPLLAEEHEVSGSCFKQLKKKKQAESLLNSLAKKGM